jgi:hypothetical protein
MNLIRLKHYHTEVERFEHPLLDDCETVSEEQLDLLVAKVLAGQPCDELVMALRKSLSILVGRYIANWGRSRVFVDEMVSEGFTAIVELCSNLTDDLLDGRAILKVVNQRCQDTIEEFLNANQCLTAPSMSTQKRRIWSGEDPLYIVTAEIAEDNDDRDTTTPVECGDEDVRDLLEAFDLIDPEDKIDAYIMDRFNWGKDNQEIANVFDVHREIVRRKRERLYQRYLELTE